MLQFMAENKRILNVSEHKFVELENFQANTTVFQTNANATLRNFETQVGQRPYPCEAHPEINFPTILRSILKISHQLQ